MRKSASPIVFFFITAACLLLGLSVLSAEVSGEYACIRLYGSAGNEARDMVFGDNSLRNRETQSGGVRAGAPIVRDMCLVLKNAHKEGARLNCDAVRARNACMESRKEGKTPGDYCKGVEWFLRLKPHCMEDRGL